jgi:hypothetical protein
LLGQVVLQVQEEQHHHMFSGKCVHIIWMFTFREQ